MLLDVSLLYRIFLFFALLEYFFQDLWRIVLGSWLGLYWICRLLSVRLPFLFCCSYLSKSMGDLFIFWYLLQRYLSFFKDLKFLSYRSFTFLDSVTPRYFKLFVYAVKGDISLIPFSDHLSFVYKKTKCSFWVDLESCHIT